MKIIISPDSFKGSLGAADVAEAIKVGILQADPTAECICIPIADGGEGTLEALVMPSEMVCAQVHDPMGEAISAAYGMCRGRAVIEMARAAGLTLIPEDQRDPMRASTCGVGEQILHAMDAGCRRFLLTVGGSGTNDSGSGLFCALGGKLYDREGNILPGGGESLCRVCKIDASALDPRLSECEFLIATDVQNPLTGALGATAVYGPQKGVTEEIQPILEAGMVRFGELLAQASGKNVAKVPGCGAGGGIAAPLLAFCRAEICSGIEAVLSSSGFDEALEGADLVITGEGRIDAQSAYGKAIGGVASHAKQKNIPVLAVGGCLGKEHEKVYQFGITQVATLEPYIPSTIPQEEKTAYSIANAKALLAAFGRDVSTYITK